MVNVLVTCGDSFGCGAGLQQESCYEKSFAGITAAHFNLPQKVYARSGCCNFTIYLQVLKVLEQVAHSTNYRPFVLITATHHSRLFMPTGDNLGYEKPDLKHVEYASYPPYNNVGTTCDPRPIEFSLDNTKYISETISNITEFQAGRISAKNHLYTDIHGDKFDALKYYFNELYIDGVKHEYDKSLYAAMHLKLKDKNIPHLIIDYANDNLNGKPELLQLSWGEYSKNYPDAYKSGHCNEEGNYLVGKKVIEHIEKYKLI